MKRTLLITLSLLGLVCTARAQQNSIPADESTIIGKLENGMTYYVRPTANAEGKADFYIVHNVGALQEEARQNGLAHFLEHMAFNGTKNYPDKTMFPFLEAEGVRFGANINAYTSRYETVYHVNSAPVARDSFVDSVLTLLRDWSCDISCEQDALDAERGVISEEWRRRDDTRTRMALKQNSLIYKGSLHTERSVIGTLEVINGFERKDILDFYHKWYRPDLQAIIVAGDIDADKMVSMIKAKFSDIPAAVNPAVKQKCEPAPLDSPLFENMNDPEITYNTLKVFHRQAFPDEQTRSGSAFYRDQLTRQMLSSIIEGRLGEELRKDSCPVRGAVVVTNAFNTDFYVTQFTFTPKSEDKMDDALAFYRSNIDRLIRYGVSSDEVESARFKVRRKLKLDIEVFDKDLTTKEIANACKENFLRGYPCIYTRERNALMNGELESISAEEVNAYIRKMFVESERIYSYSINESKAELIPDKQRMLAVIDSVDRSDIKPEYMNFKQIDLKVADGRDCRIVRESKDKVGKVWTLDNGSKVFWTPSEPVESNTHLAMFVKYESGYGSLDGKGNASERVAISFLDRWGGLRDVSRSEFKSMPQSAGVNLLVDIGRYASRVRVSADEKNCEKAFAIAALQLKDPYFGSEKELGQFKASLLASLKKPVSNTNKFNEEVKKARYGDNPSLSKPTEEEIEAVDMEVVQRVWEQSFSGNAEIYICSDMDEGTVKELVCRYFGSLPQRVRSGEKTERLVPLYKGEGNLTSTVPASSAPKATVKCCFKSETKVNRRQMLALDILDYVMSKRYIDLIREERGGTYSVSFNTEIYPISGYYESCVEFQTRPEMLDLLVADVYDELHRAGWDGISQEEFDNAVKYLRKVHMERQKRIANSVVSKNFERHDQLKYGTCDIYDFDAVVSRIKTSDIEKLARKVYKSDKYRYILIEE